MRIRCSCLGSFFENLESGEVHRNAVYFERTRTPVNDGPNPVTFELVLHTSAILVFSKTDALCEASEYCGIDRETADGTREGSERMDCLHNQLKAFCKEHSLRLLPGILDI